MPRFDEGWVPIHWGLWETARERYFAETEKFLEDFVKHSYYRIGGAMVSPETLKVVQMLNSPHYKTIIKVWQADEGGQGSNVGSPKEL